MAGTGTTATYVACATCRRRRKRCDKTHPHCYRCIKAGLACEGYTTAPSKSRWQDREARSQRQAAHSSAQASIVLPDSLARSANTELCYGAFASGALPAGRGYSSRAASLAAVGWINYVPQLSLSEGALKGTLMLTGMALLALETHDISLRLRSFHLYTSVIQAMVKASTHPGWYKRDGMLAATRLLLCYEFFLPVADGGQLPECHACHVDGTQALLLARGPHAFTSGISHHLYTDSRNSLIFSAIIRKKRSPFCTTAWRTVPWTTQPKTVKDSFLDTLQELPAILEQFAAFQSLRDVGSTKYLEEMIVDQCHEIEDKFDEWKRQYSPDILRFDFMHSTSDMIPPQDDAELSLLHLSMMYWIALMILHSVLRFFVHRDGTAENAKSMPNAGPISETAKSDGRLLCSSEERMSPHPDLYASKCIHALQLFGDYTGSAAETMSIMVPLWFSMRYYLSKASRPYMGDEAELLRSALRRKLYGSPAWSHLTKISGQISDVDSTMNGEKTTTDSVFWF